MLTWHLEHVQGVWAGAGRWALCGDAAGAYLPLRGLDHLPVAEFQLVQLVELHADVLNGQLQHVPVAGQILGSGPGHSAGVLPDTGTVRATETSGWGGVQEKPP